MASDSHLFKCNRLTRLLAILRILLADEQLGDDVSIPALAKRTESFSGSDLKRESDYQVSSLADFQQIYALLLLWTPSKNTHVCHGLFPGRTHFLLHLQ